MLPCTGREGLTEVGGFSEMLSLPDTDNMVGTDNRGHVDSGTAEGGGGVGVRNQLCGGIQFHAGEC